MREITAIRDRISGLSGDRERLAELLEIEEALRPFNLAPVELLLDLLLAYRSVEAWDRLVALTEAAPEVVRNHVTVQEQLAQALGRRNEGDDRQHAIEILHEVTERFGPSAETSGILGGIYKRQYEQWQLEEREHEASAALDAAIEAYAEGFEADPRDAYPGINLLTLLTNRDAAGDRERIGALSPVVAFALSRRGVDRSSDYWDIATALELAVLSADWAAAERAAGRLSLVKSEPWMFATTADNLEILAAAFARRDGSAPVELERLVEHHALATHVAHSASVAGSLTVGSISPSSSVV